MLHWLSPRKRGLASGSTSFFLVRVLPLLLFASVFMPRLAYANECPNMSIQDTSAGTTTFAVPACSPFGTNVPPFAMQPSHGTVTVSNNDYDITYVNNGDGATSDSFAWYDDEGEAITVTVTITSSAPAPIVLSPTTAPNGNVGTAYSLQFSATGGNGGPYTYVINAGILPTGVSDNAAGLISGTPTESGTFNFTETATDSTGHVGTQNITLTVIGAIAITPSTLPTATAYVAYNQTLSATGGTAPYTFSRASGSNALPPGINLSASGTLSGTPTATGNTTITLVVADASGSSDQQTFTFAVVAPTITLSPASLPGVDQGGAYSQTLSASGGTAPYTYAVTAGAVPAGMTLSSAGVLSGTPTGSGTSTFTVTATDAHGFTGVHNNYSVVVAPPLQLTPATIPAAQVGMAYSSTLSASGGIAPYTYALTSGTLPAGVSLNASTGALSGTPTAGGSFSPVIAVADATDASVSHLYTFTVQAPSITVTPATLPTATQGNAYSQSVSASGGIAPYTYAITSGVLPAGLALSSAGVLSGTPSVSGGFNFTITATDSSTGSGPYQGSRAYSLIVIAGAPNITTSSLPAGTADVAYSQTIAGTGGAAPYSFAITAGVLPSGLSLSSVGVLSGTPTQGGSFPVTVTLTDANSNTATASYTLQVNAATVTVAPATLPSAIDGMSYSQTLTASGGTAPYTYALTSGALPAGINLSANGTLRGTPAAGGTFTITVQATDSSTGTGPFSGTRTYSFTVNAPTLSLSPSSGTNLSGTAGVTYSQAFTASGGTGPYTYAETGTLPTGLSWNAATGTVSGTASQAGTFPISISATDHSTGSGPYSVTDNYTLAVSAPTLTLSPGALPAPSLGTAYSQTVTASGGTAPYTYTISTGALPAGVQLNGSTGTISGTPTASGTFNFTLQATDANHFTAIQAYSVTIAAPTLALAPNTLPAATAETVYSQTLTTTGGTAPYTYSISSGALPTGLSLNASTGALSGTSTASGTFNFTVRSVDSSTGSGAPFAATHAYTFVVSAPTVTLSPTTLPGAQVAAAYSQTLTATGGNGAYTYSVTTGALPAGLTLSSSGVLSGMPTASGTFNLTVTATDGLGFTGTQAYTLNVQQAKPVAVNDTANTPANQAVTIAVTSVDTGPITSIAIATPPAHGTATVSGLNIVYTPTHDYFGTDTLTYTAMGPGGISSAATVTITVTPLAVPTVPAQSATVLAGNSVTINATKGASGGPFTAVTITKAPTSGTATVSGNDILYTAAADASDQQSLTYTLTNAFGVSLPATITITVDARPVAASHSASDVAGSAVQVNLTQGATGGPFTAATLISISPGNAGSARIVTASGNYQLDFTAAPTFTGTATVMFTLSNAYATSAPGTVTIEVTARPDPSKDAEVLGVLGAQTDATRRFAQGQIDNFQQRLEALHDGGGQGIQNGLTFSSDASSAEIPSTQWSGSTKHGGPSDFDNSYLTQPPAATNPGPSLLPDGYAIWTSGAVNFGSRSTSTSASGFDFTTGGLSLGADKRISNMFALGVGFGYGRDDTDVGHNGSLSTGNSYSFAGYASYSPSPSIFVDGLVGYQWLSFDARRYVTTDNGLVNGHRDGTQWFASLSAGYEYRNEALLLSPYGRLDVASAQLDGYTEQGDAIYALTYQSQTVKTTTTSLGVHMDYAFKEDFGTVAPQVRVEYQHDFQGSSQATMSYADLLAGPVYNAAVDPLAHNHFLIGIGTNWQFNNGLMLRLEYQDQIDTGDQSNQSILLNMQKRF